MDLETLEQAAKVTDMITDKHLYRDCSEEAIAQLVDSIKESPERVDLMVELLPERVPLYKGRSSNATIRIRGYILAAFEQASLPDAALPYVLEELESGRHAYLVAGAAKALRGLKSPADWLAPYLLKAVENIKDRDDALTFEQYKPQWPVENYTTALTEVFQTLGWLGVHARVALPDLEAMCDARRGEFSEHIRAEIAAAMERIRSEDKTPHACCSSTSAPLNMAVYTSRESRAKSGPIAEVELEDQDRNALTYGAFFKGKPSIVVFFYTRCNNPNKCSLTITKLAKLQKAIIEERSEGMLKTAAITYDPEYDLPPRLKAYGENRGMSFSEDNRMFRNRSGFNALWEFFQLGVNFTEATVNQHRIELFILDEQGEIAATFSRLQWEVQEVLEQARVLLRSDFSIP